ncbi:MAG: sigma factor-like helix-turn-helix DNA-binding protein, partial [Atribacterota bacterium]|nr:sigma factor-like helix-turn-helix DNA-binding protein [Atribacterota bacterium]
DQFNITEDGIREVLKGRNAVQVVSLDKELRQDEQENIPMLEQIKSKEYRSFQLPVEDSIQLRNALHSLKKIQKQVIYYLFFKDLTQTNVAKKLGLTQRQVSRIKQEAIDELRKNL